MFRLKHRAGEKRFVALLGASSYTFAEATRRTRCRTAVCIRRQDLAGLWAGSSDLSGKATACATHACWRKGAWLMAMDAMSSSAA